MSLREYKKDQLRERIIQTSIDMFSKNGFDQTTIEDITFKLEISKRTFFRYFSAKEDVVLSLYDNLINSDNQNYIIFTKDSNMNNPMIAIKSIFNNFAETYASKESYFLNIEKLIDITPSIKVRKIEKILQCTSQVAISFVNKCSSHKRPTLDHNFIIHFSMGILMSAISSWVESNGEINLKQTINYGFNLIEQRI